MNIYKLARLGKVYHDEASAFIVFAMSEDEARRIAGDEAGDEGQYTWVDPSLTSCEHIGEGLDAQSPGVACRSFNAG